MKSHRARVVGGVLGGALLIGVIYFGFLRSKPERRPDPDPAPQPGQNGKEKDKPPAAYQPAPLALTDVARTLYAGPDARQTGFKEGALDTMRAAILRGKVHGRDGKPLANVAVSVAHHPEYGSSRTDAAGVFDLAVNGGATLCLDYRGDGLLPLCRKVAAPWQDYAWLPDVVLSPLDPAATPINLKDPAPVQVARGSVVKDKDGERQATLFFFQGTTAEMFLSDRSKKPLDTLTVRITEYTVGTTGPAAMPAQLPPMSAYTYACELTADEVAAAGGIKVGGKDVVLSRPAVFYLENFLKFPVGTPIPMGYFDNDRGAWVAADNGQVVQVLAVNDRLAELDLDGKGKPADAAALKRLAITDAERAQLAVLYKSGQALWRVPMNHFSTPDLNHAPDDAQAPEGEGSGGPGTDCPPPTASYSGGSVIDIHNQTLREEIAVAGTPLRLHYQSGRAQGHAAGRSLAIPLSGAEIPKSLKGIELEVHVAGQRFTKSFPGQPNQSYSFVWDGKDGYGRPVGGSQKATVRLGYVYDGVYGVPSRFGEPALRPTPTRSRQEFTYWREERVPIGGLDARVLHLGGWSLSAQHHYDPVSRVLHLGDGRRWGGAGGVAHATNRAIVTVAGGGSNFALGDGGPAIQARLDNLKPPTGAGFQRNRMARFPRGLAVGPDGSLYIADGNGLIRKVAPHGAISTIAGGGKKDAVDGTPGADAALKDPRTLAFGPDGGLYIAEAGARRILRLSPDGILSTVAGTGGQGTGGDGGPARKAQLNTPTGLAVGEDGSIYVADVFAHRVRRIGPDGIITTVAGTGKQGYSGDGGPGGAAQLYWPTSLALATDGSLYIADTGNYVVRRLSPAGVLTTIAGMYRDGWEKLFSGDDGPAVKAEFNEPTTIAVGPDGALYVADTENHRIRRVGVDGIVTTVVGSAVEDSQVGGFAGDGGPASQAQLSFPAGLAVGPDGGLFCYDGRAIADRGKEPTLHRVRRVAPPLPGFTGQEMLVASEDGQHLFKFDSSGKHLETLDAVTRAMVFRFHYDPHGRLHKVDDPYGTILTVERNEGGHPAALVGRHGQRTALEVNDEGYLRKVVAPGDEEYRLAYHPGGLLAAFEPPGRAASRFAYDELGRLTRDDDPAGGFVELKRTAAGRNYEVALTTALKPATVHRVERLPAGQERRIEKCCCGAETLVTKVGDGGYNTQHPDGTLEAIRFQPDPRWGQQILLLKSATLTTPAGRKAEFGLERKAVLAQPNNPLSVTELIDTQVFNGRKLTRTFDVGKRRLVARTAEGREAAATLNEQGQVVRVETPGVLPVVYRYDRFGRAEAVQQGEGDVARVVSFGYDDAGRLFRISNPHRGELRFEYDKAGRIAKTMLPDGREVLTAFDPLGNLRSLTPPGRPAHTFDFTPGNLPQASRPPAADGANAATTYEFDRDRKLTKLTRTDGKAVLLEYTPVGLIDTLTTPTGKLKFTHDAPREKLTRIESPDGALSLAYDGFLPTGVKWDGAIKGSVTRDYDNDFRVVATRVNDGHEVAFGYDGDGLLVKAGELSLDRDPRTGFLRGTQLGKVATTQEYNPFGERSRSVARFDNKDVMTIDYERDPLGRIVKKTETIDGKTDVYVYAFDRAGRLIGVTLSGQPVGRYEYDANGNRLKSEGRLGSFAGSYDAQDRVLQYGGATFTHSANGEWLTRAENGRTTRYDYDALGNLRAVDLPDGTKVEYLIDGGNRRIGKKVNGKLVHGWLWEGRLRPVAELDGDGNLVSRFVYATGINVPEYMQRDGKTYRLVADHLGSVRLVVDAATGEVAQRIDYDEFGNVLQDTKPGFQPFGFAGGLYDPQTKLVRFGARDYDATTGRWTAKDPIGFRGDDGNLYSYVRNDPANLMDTGGLEPNSTEENWFGYVAGAAGVLSATGSVVKAWGLTGVSGGAGTWMAYTSTVPASAVYGGGSVGIAGAGTAISGVAGAFALGLGAGYGLMYNPWADYIRVPGTGYTFGDLGRGQPGMDFYDWGAGWGLWGGDFGYQGSGSVWGWWWGWFSGFFGGGC